MSPGGGVSFWESGLLHSPGDGKQKSPEVVPGSDSKWGHCSPTGSWTGGVPLPHSPQHSCVLCILASGHEFTPPDWHLSEPWERPPCPTIRPVASRWHSVTVSRDLKVVGHSHTPFAVTGSLSAMGIASRLTAAPGSEGGLLVPAGGACA